MAAQTLKVGNKRFVVIPEGEYLQLKAKATNKAKATKTKSRPRLSRQDRGDIAEVKRRLAEPGGQTGGRGVPPTGDLRVGYALIVNPGAERDLERLDRSIARRIQPKLLALRTTRDRPAR